MSTLLFMVSVFGFGWLIQFTTGLSGDKAMVALLFGGLSFIIPHFILKCYDK